MLTFSKLGSMGRLGNQLFQIASTIGIAYRNGTEFCFPAWAYSDYFKNKLPVCYTGNWSKYLERTSYYQDIDLPVGTNWDLDGYFQSWKYFDSCKETVRHYLDLPTNVVDRVAVHVRRGDYMRLQHIHPLLPVEYYESALANFSGRQIDIFSDDIQWCHDNLAGKNRNFIPPSYDIDDFMALASHSDFVIANSSYSWWAAWLSKSEDKQVFAPKTYVIGEEHDDRIPPEWIKI